MIGAMPAVTVKHERRNNAKDKDAIPGLLGPTKNLRPKELLLKPKPPGGCGGRGGGEGGGSCGASGAASRLSSPAGSLLPPGDGSNAVSRAGSPTVDTDPPVVFYGDECCYAKVALLHFIVFFFLGGLTVIIVGAVQASCDFGVCERNRYRNHEGE
jgi:hypothetical protein